MKSLLRLFLTSLLITWIVRGKAEAADLKPVPSIKYAGVLPVYWQGESSPALRKKKPWIDEAFVKIVRDSKRYIFLNDTIISDHWANAEGRKKLKDDYELDAFLNLNVTEQGDVAIFTVRLLSPELENYVSETDRLPLSWINAATEDDLNQKLRDLSFRVLNRYPIDVFVTSLQGRYITLSAGKDQNVLEGDSLEFADFSIKSTHPVDGTWLEFQQRPLGKAKIVESKNQSSIALITSLTSENAIKIGSGARVADIASRRNFKAKPKAEDAFIASEPDSPLVRAPGQTKREVAPPVPLVSPSPSPSPVKGPEGTLKGKEAEPTEVDSEPMHPTARGQEPVAQPNPVGPEADGDGGFSPNFNLSNVRFGLANETWNYSGPAKASTGSAPLFFNSIAAYAEHDIDATTTSMFDLTIQSGDTKRGSYFGLVAGGEFLYKIAGANAMIASIDRILIGGRAEAETIGVSKESFGGMDAMHIAPVIHAQGTYHFVDLVQTYTYDLSAKLVPLHFGSAGIKGKTLDLGSGIGVDVEAQVLNKSRTDSWEWGGLVGFRQGSWEMGKGTLARDSFRLGLLARMKN